MSNKRLDLQGKIFGKLVVIKFQESIGGHTHWLCQCECGNTKVIMGSTLLKGNTNSCGCNRKGINKTHGLSQHKLYDVYNQMVNRCNNPDSKDFHNYGARGITVCKEWDNITKFYNWAMKNGYHENVSIDRIDNNKGYCPSNCQWVGQKTQANNTRKNRLISFNGKTKTLAQWAETTGINKSTLSARLNAYGWDIERALSES